MIDRIPPWADDLPPDLTPEQGMQLAHDRMAWRKAGYPDPKDFDDWGDDQSLDYLVSRPTMDTLILNELKLARFPDGLERIKDLDYLFLMSNGITEIPDSFLRKASILSLNLFDNALSKVPAALFALNRLEDLYLGRNPIRAVATPDKENAKLKFLLLDQCPRIQIPDDFFSKFPNLKSIALNGSALTRLPLSVFSLTGLKQLDIEDNPLGQLQPEIGNLKALTRLNVSNCELTTLPKSLAEAKGLRDIMSRSALDMFGIRLAGNPFTDKELRKISKLKNPARTLQALDWCAANGS